jgi:NAD(P)-dependent dehydrogenase (short-subunit alcohol dehydrogenase family)
LAGSPCNLLERAMDSTDELIPPLPRQQQDVPGTTAAMNPRPDHGEDSYSGSRRLEGKAAIITGGDSGIGRAVAIAFAREGADVLISYLNEDEDARDTAQWIERAGRRAVLVPGDIGSPEHCRAIVAKAVEALGRLDILVNNAAQQMTFETLEEIPDEEWDRTFRTNIHAMFYLAKAAVPHMKEGGAIINTTSVNADMPKQTLLPYATTKGAIQNFTGGLAQLLAEKGIRVNCVAPGPVWTPLIPSTMPPGQVEEFGKSYPIGRPAQPKELAPVYVMLASDEASYVSGATVAVTGGKPFI